MPVPSNDLKRQFWVRMGLDALRRRETIAAAAGSIVAAIASRLPPLADRLPSMSSKAILAFGTVATLWVLWEALRDERRQARIVGVLGTRAGLDDLRDDGLRLTVSQALETSRHIDDLLRSMDRDGTMPRNLLPELDGWFRQFLALAARLDVLKRELSFVIDRSDMAKLRMADVERRLEHEKNPGMREEFERVLLGYRKLSAYPIDIAAIVERSDLKLQQSASLLSSVHGALVLLGTTGLETGAAERLLEGISDDILDLEAMITSTVRLASAHST